MTTKIPAELPSWLIDDYDDDLKLWSLVVCSIDEASQSVAIDADLLSELKKLGATFIAVVVDSQSLEIVSEIAVKLPLGDPDILNLLVIAGYIRTYSEIALADSDSTSRWLFASIPVRTQGIE